MSLKEKLALLFLKPYIRRKARKSLPQLEGVVTLKGLNGPVKVLRDAWGVPHIYADSISDLAYAQGYVHAQDRLWQMELNRRVSRGGISEVAGKAALDTDRATRTLGFERLAIEDYKTIGDDVKGHLHDYCNGVNAFIEQNQKKLPVEFGLLKFAPKPWEPIDVMAFSRMLAWQMCYAWYGEIIRAKIIDKVGVEHASEIEIHYPKENPATLDIHAEFNVVLDDGRLQAFKGPYLQPIKGSNGWTVAGSRTTTGNPILCNDPHLPLMQPAIWYENHLHGGDIHVSGVSLPGAPLVMIGHNENIAWGMTLAFTDIQDVFIEKFTDNGATHYHFKDKILPSTIIEETIKVKSEPDHIEKVIITHHGPVISDVVGEKGLKLALCSKALGRSGMLQGWYQLNRAANWDDFINAARHINAPALNVPYADVHGNIGYWATGEVPIRKEGQATVPSEGWTGKNEWEGIVPFKDMPHAFNPSKGYVGTCNHKIIPEDYPYYLGNSWMNGFRANRLDKLFAQQEKFSPDDMRTLQMDIHSTPAQQFIQHFKGLNLAAEQPILTQMNELLTSWDGALTTETTGGCIYEVVKHFMFEVVLNPKLGEGLTKHLRGKTYSETLTAQYEFYGYDTVTLMRLLDTPDSWWVREAGGKRRILVDSLELAADYLVAKLGKDPDKWHWGRLHTTVLHHIIGGQKPMDKIFNQGPFPLPGDTDTLLQTACMAHDPLGTHIIAPSYRQIIDLGNLSNSRAVMPPGQSGNMCSPYYNDQMQLWLDGAYHPMLWEKEEVEAHMKHTLVLMPETAAPMVEAGN